KRGNCHLCERYRQERRKEGRQKEREKGRQERREKGPEERTAPHSEEGYQARRDAGHWQDRRRHRPHSSHAAGWYGNPFHDEEGNRPEGSSTRRGRACLSRYFRPHISLSRCGIDEAAARYRKGKAGAGSGPPRCRWKDILVHQGFQGRKTGGHGQ